jgi:2-methylisocitrate lyase-like PEP mutase family enzyme
LRRQAVLPFLTFEPELQAKTDQKWLKNLEKRLQYAHEVPVLVDNGNGYSRARSTVEDTVKAFYSVR